MRTGPSEDVDLFSDVRGTSGEVADDVIAVIRPQWAGDKVLTRPVFVAREWAERCCDTSEG
jgi:hypothetical protein